MADGLSPSSFRARGHATLGVLGLEPVLDAVLDALLERAAHLAYYHNPHVVLSLKLGASSEIEDIASTHWRASATGAAAIPPHAGSFDGGVHEGTSEHVEAYVDRTNDRSAYALHQAGRSFRIRISRSATDPDDVRVLLISSQAPFGVSIDHAALGAQWAQLTASDSFGFRALRPDAAWLAARGALPSVVDCLAIFTRDWAGTVSALDDVLSSLPSPGLHVVARSRKRSRRTSLRPWIQDPVTGFMDPAWAYAVLDHVQLELEPQLAERLGEHAAEWHSFSQIELEAGPSIPELRAAAQLFDETEARMRSATVSVEQVYGRKYHRLLMAAGIK